MGKNSGIEWTTHTFNPWIGCTRISPACDHCYAADWDRRYHNGEHWGAGAPRRRTSADNWRQPRKWARQARETGERPRVFCCSLADVFDNEVPAEWREDLWQVIRDTPELDWLLLTKRIGNVRQMLPEDWGDGWSHVWLGITVVTQAEVDRDVPKLLDVPAAERFLSCEPLLESVKLRHWHCLCGWTCRESDRTRDMECPQCGLSAGLMFDYFGVDWVIAGGESGPHARPMHPDWARSLRDQCAAAGVPFLFKQWGEWVPCGMVEDETAHPQSMLDGTIMCRVGKKAAGRLLDSREHNEIPTTRAGV